MLRRSILVRVHGPVSAFKTGSRKSLCVPHGNSPEVKSKPPSQQVRWAKDISVVLDSFYLKQTANMHQRKTRPLLEYRLFAQSILVLCAAAALLSAQAVPLLPNIRYWPDVPTPRGGLGFDIGMRHLQHHELVKYMHAVADASPRVKLQEYARTHGGKPLLLLTITSPANHKQLDRIRKQHRRLTDPSRSGEVDIESLPVVINMGYGVHGNEPSGTNCAPLVVYYLAAALDRQVEKLLEDCVVLVDPCLNPDGFERFASWSNNHRGRHPNPDPSDREHDEPWPSGRTNYYWFDLNRDWLPLEHPESQGRMQWYHQWKPNVVLDFHEMGSGATYFFQPGIPSRGNPLIPDSNVQLTRQIAKFHAKAFDKLGELYYTEESFDDFYLGKGSSYPDVHGAVGILFEQASSRGMVQKTKHGTRRFSDTVRNQLTTSLSSLEAVAETTSQIK